MVQRPCLLTNEGLLVDAAVVARLGSHAGVGVAHGWSKIAGAFRITEAENTVLKSLDWRPAFEVYREVVEAHSGQTFSDDNFFDIAKAYPFGLARLDAEHIVRDPLMTRDDGALICVDTISVNVLKAGQERAFRDAIRCPGYAREAVAETRLQFAGGF